MNEHWKILALGGVEIASTPGQMWEQALAYFEFCDGNPIENKETLKTGKTQGQVANKEKRRPYTVKGLCLHLGISEQYLREMGQQHGTDSMWFKVAEKILSVIYVQNLEGAIVEDFNPQIISKVLNLDKPSEEDSKPVRVEIVDTRKRELPTDEKSILDNLDFNLVQSFKSKLSEGDSA